MFLAQTSQNSFALCQLEGAHGGVDVEARQKLELLKAQLQVMESVQQGTGPAPGPQLETEVAVAKELDR